MSIQQRIKDVLRGLPPGRASVASALEALTENIPGVAFPKVLVVRDDGGAIIRLDVSFMDEIHDPSLRRISIDMTAQDRS